MVKSIRTAVVVLSCSLLFACDSGGELAGFTADATSPLDVMSEYVQRNTAPADAALSELNMFDNSDFENGLDGWSGCATDAIASSDDAHNGSGALALNAGYCFFRSVVAEPGEQLVLSCYAKIANTVWTGMGLGFSNENWQTVAESDVTLVNGNEYRRYDVRATVPANARYASMWFYSETDALVDGCTLSTEPVDTGNRIAAQLRDDALDNIVIGDASQPIINGSWPRFTPYTSWTWQLLGDTNTDYPVDVYVVDMFQQLEGDVIERLHAQNKTVICYFSAGTFEPWRPDAHLFENVPMGNPHYGYPSENWVSVTSVETAKVMANRMDMAVALGCDGVELDNVDGFVANTGLDITQQQEMEYQRLLANEAHKRNLAVALKNSVETIPDVVDYFDLAINEVCFIWNECGTYSALIDAGKPVFHVEYDQAYVDDETARADMCARSAELNMRTLVLPKLLDGSFRLSCDPS